MAANGDQFARILGPGWETMGMSRLFDRSYQHEKAAKFAAAPAHYLVETGGGTAGEASARLRGPVGWPTTSQAPPVARATGLGEGG